MAEKNVDTSIVGKKTFFIAPSPDMIPEEYLQAYLSHGYECYIVANDSSFPLAGKIKTIISLFPDSLLIFDTTVSLPGINWESYIQDLQKNYGDKITISVIYSKKWASKEKEHFKSFYTDTAKIQGGFIGLEPNHIKNFERLTRILTKNKVGGRRKSVRAVCPAGSSVAFAYNAQTYTASLVDMSMTHFCADIQISGLNIPIYQRIKDAVIVINGMQFSSDIVLILRRSEKDTVRCIFMFTKQGGMPGLSGELETKLATQLHGLLSDSCLKTLKKEYN